MSDVNSVVFGVWFLIGAALVFWMQAGFAMVEAGFTRAKNTGNIIMKTWDEVNESTWSDLSVLRWVDLVKVEDVPTDIENVIIKYDWGDL